MIASVAEGLNRKVRSGVGISAIVEIILGALILFWHNAPTAIVDIMAVGFLVIGLYYLIISFGSDYGDQGWARVGHLLLAALYIGVGVGQFVVLAHSKSAAIGEVFWVIGIMVGITWITEGFMGFGSLGYFESTSRGWTIFASIISVIAGFSLLFAPLYGAAILFNFAGWLLLIVGIVNIFRFFFWK